MSKILPRTIVRNILNIICLAAIITAVLSLGIASDSDSFIAGITGTPTTKAATSPTVVTVGASASPDGTATLYGNLSDPGSAASVTVSFEYGTTTSYGSTVAGVPATLTSAGDFSADLTGLTLDQTYHFRAKAVGDGTVNGTDATFTVGTPPAVTPPVVTTNGASGITDTSATLNGNLSNPGSAASVTVSFEYGTTTSYGSAATGVPATRTSAGDFTANLTGLISGQTYHFRAKAMGDETVYGNDVTFTTTSTLPEVTPPVVTTNGASGITDTSATLNGNLSDPGSAASVTVSFAYGTTTSYGSTAAGVPATLTSVGAFTANLTSLTPGQTYHFIAIAAGDGTVYGSDTTFTTTTVIPPAVTPPAVTTNGASGITTTSAALNGNLSGLGSAASVTVSFIYGTTTSYGSAAAGVPPTLTSAGAFTANLTSLTPGQTYHFIAIAAGDGTVYGSDTTFTTTTVIPPAVTPPGVITNGASGITTTSATLNGNLSNTGSAASVTVSFEYGTTTSYGTPVAGVPATLTSVGAFTADLTGLASGQTYHFRAKAVGDGTVYGNDATFTTTGNPPEVIPSEVITNNASGITDTSATLNGNLSGLGSASSVTVSFEYGTTTSYGSAAAGVPPTRTGTGTFTANLTGLTSGQTYHFRAKAVGDGTVYGSDVTFTTTVTPPKGNPPEVITNNASGITDTSATLNGNLSALGSASSVTVSFEYGKTTSYGTTAARVPSTRTGTGTFTANLTGLTSGQTYHFRAKAVGNGTVYGNDATFTTTGTLPEVIPPEVITNDASGITDTSATLNGNLSDLGSASSITVSFEYGTTTSYGSETASVTPTFTSNGAFTANLTDLTPGQTYHFRTKAVGDGTVYGSDATFNTATVSKTESNWPLIAGIAGGTIAVGLIVLFIFRHRIIG